MANILLIDDDPDILKFGSVVLKSNGHETYLAENADQAMDHIKNQIIHLALCDVNMPHITGFDLLNHIRSQPKYRHLPIALLTGRREKEDVQKAIKLGVSDYIVKPIQPELLIEKVDQLLNRTPPTKTVYEFATDFIPHADVIVGMSVISISDQELKLHSPSPLTKGETFQLSTSVFAQMGIEEIKLLVEESEQNEKGLFTITASLDLVDDLTLRRIAAWIRARNREKVHNRAG